MHRRLRRFLTAFAALAVVAVMAAACSSDGFPVSYDDQPDPETGLSNVEANWMAGCVPSFDDPLAAEAQQICECSYARITREVPFEEFVAVNDRLADNPEILANVDTTPGTEQVIVNIVRDCIADA